MSAKSSVRLSGVRLSFVLTTSAPPAKALLNFTAQNYNNYFNYTNNSLIFKKKDKEKAPLNDKFNGAIGIRIIIIIIV